MRRPPLTGFVLGEGRGQEIEGVNPRGVIGERKSIRIGGGGLRDGSRANTG